MKLLDEYFEIQQDIYNYFGYKEDWKIIPLDDRREYYWYLTDNKVICAKKLDNFKTGEYSGDEIYTQRFLPKYVYKAEDYTRISVDTHTDGNKFLAIYSNTKKLNENPIADEY